MKKQHVYGPRYENLKLVVNTLFLSVPELANLVIVRVRKSNTSADGIAICRFFQSRLAQQTDSTRTKKTSSCCVIDISYV